MGADGAETRVVAENFSTVFADDILTRKPENERGFFVAGSNDPILVDGDKAAGQMFRLEGIVGRQSCLLSKNSEGGTMCRFYYMVK